jgi:hypothetical protein
MKSPLLLIVASASIPLAAEKRIQMKDLPAAVQQAKMERTLEKRCRSLGRFAIVS